jgi:hypothetical protein
MNTTIINLKREKSLAEHPAGMFWAQTEHLPVTHRVKKKAPPLPPLLTSWRCRFSHRIISIHVAINTAIKGSDVTNKNKRQLKKNSIPNGIML